MGRINVGVVQSYGVPGSDGLSAYQLAVNRGFLGTEDEWLASLKGDPGDPGPPGDPGGSGVPAGGTAGQVLAKNSSTDGDVSWADQGAGPAGPAGADGADGEDGLSAYELAVANGFVGDLTAWLASLQGPPGADGAPGAPGTPGADGADGADGASAYESAVANGFVGTEVQWLASLQGPAGADGADGMDGAPGSPGLSAYAEAVANGFVGTFEQWVNSLIGDEITDSSDPIETDDRLIVERAVGSVLHSVPVSALPASGGGYSTAAAVRDALEALTGTDRLDASAIQNLPSLSPGDPVTVSHDGAGADPVVGDTVSVTFAAGWSGSVQWLRDGVAISGATSTSYVLVEADANTDVSPRITSLQFVAPALPVGGPAATAPAAFTVGQWSLTPIAGGFRIGVTALPDDGGSPLTDLERLIEGGSWTSMGAATTGNYDVTGLAAVETDVQIRAVNAIGNGTASDIKTDTPLAAGGSMEWVGAGTAYSTFSALTTHDIAVPAGTQVGDMLILATFPWGTISSVDTNTAQNLTLLADYASANEVGRLYGVVVSGSVPTTITVTMSSANDFQAQAFTARGVTQSAGVVNDGNSFSARTDLTYTTDATDALVITTYTTVGSNARVLTAFTPAGGSGDVYAKWDSAPYGVATGVHNGATGANNAAVTWSESDASGGRWLSLALKP